MLRFEGPNVEKLNAPRSVPWAAPFASLLRDIPVLVAALALFYGLLSLTGYWMGPVNTQATIDLHPSALFRYAFFSVARLMLAYVLSLAITLVYAYAAAHNARAERVLLPLLDTLQSIPVLSFLPPVMVAMVALFPASQFGVELGSIVLITTGQVWNMTFSVYSSLKNVPREMLEAAEVYRLSWWQKFIQVELPFAAIGLVWNSMMSVAGGWFFLMACEMFVLGNRDLRLPGLGSYLQTAANLGDVRAILWGLGAMIAVIVMMDQLIWRPLIAWSRKFKFEQVEAMDAPRSAVFELLRRSRVARYFGPALASYLAERLSLRLAASQGAPNDFASAWWRVAVRRGLLVMGAMGVLYGVAQLGLVLTHVSSREVLGISRGAGATFLRVVFVLCIAALWTIPVGVAVGMRPTLASMAQPVVQIAASVPATALFPIVLLALIRVGGGLGIGSILLLLLGTQWYILFNVIAGASAIPTDLQEVCRVYRLSTFERWRKLILPAIFPYLITGLVTASGGAWNASVVAEYFRFHGQTITTTGLGSLISRATDTANLPVLLAATIVMASMIVTVNRLLWRRMYTLAATKFSLNG